MFLLEWSENACTNIVIESSIVLRNTSHIEGGNTVQGNGATAAKLNFETTKIVSQSVEENQTSHVNINGAIFNRNSEEMLETSFHPRTSPLNIIDQKSVSLVNGYVGRSSEWSKWEMGAVVVIIFVIFFRKKGKLRKIPRSRQGIPSDNSSDNIS